MVYREVWHCDPTAPRRCPDGRPCRGHAASRQLLDDAYLLSWLAGMDRADLTQSALRGWLRQAWQLRHRVTAGEPPGDWFKFRFAFQAGTAYAAHEIADLLEAQDLPTAPVYRWLTREAGSGVMPDDAAQ